MDEAEQPLSINSENESSTKSCSHEGSLASSPPQLSGYGRGALFRFIILLCISLIAFGSYFAYDSISALEETLIKVLGLTKSMFSLFFSIYAIPNIFIVIGSGFFIDKIGNQMAALIFCTLIAAGSVVVAAAPSLPFLTPLSIYLIMLFGRFIFGIGSEASYVVQNSMCVEWFQGKHLAKAMAFTTVIARLGSITAFNIEFTIATQFGNYLHALWFASLTCIISLLASMVYVMMDRWAKYKYQYDGGIVVEIHSNKVSLRDLRSLSGRYWLCAGIAMTIYMAIYAFRSLSSPYISKKFGYDNEWALFCVSIIDISSMLTSPFFGWIVDRTGFRGYLVIVGNALAVVGFLLMGFTFFNPLFVSILLGVHFALMPAALWPGIAVLVDQRVEGTAFAIVSALINLGTTLMFPAVGYVGENFGFKFFCLLLAAVSVLSVLLAIIWNVVDARSQIPILNVRSR